MRSVLGSGAVVLLGLGYVGKGSPRPSRIVQRELEELLPRAIGKGVSLQEAAAVVYQTLVDQPIGGVRRDRERGRPRCRGPSGDRDRSYAVGPD